MIVKVRYFYSKPYAVKFEPLWLEGHVDPSHVRASQRNFDGTLTIWFGQENSMHFIVHEDDAQKVLDAMGQRDPHEKTMSTEELNAGLEREVRKAMDERKPRGAIDTGQLIEGIHYMNANLQDIIAAPGFDNDYFARMLRSYCSKAPEALSAVAFRERWHSYPYPLCRG